MSKGTGGRGRVARRSKSTGPRAASRSAGPDARGKANKSTPARKQSRAATGKSGAKSPSNADARIPTPTPRQLLESAYESLSDLHHSPTLHAALLADCAHLLLQIDDRPAALARLDQAFQLVRDDLLSARGLPRSTSFQENRAIERLIEALEAASCLARLDDLAACLRNRADSLRTDPPPAGYDVSQAPEFFDRLQEARAAAAAAVVSAHAGDAAGARRRFGRTLVVLEGIRSNPMMWAPAMHHVARQQVRAGFVEDGRSSFAEVRRYFTSEDEDRDDPSEPLAELASAQREAQLFEDALETALGIPDPFFGGSAIADVGEAAHRANQDAPAMRAFAAAAELAAASLSSDNPDAAHQIYLHLATSLARADLVREARDTYSKGAAIPLEHPDTLTADDARYELALSAAWLGNVAIAREMVQLIGEPDWRAVALAALGLALKRKGKTTAARDCLQSAAAAAENHLSDEDLKGWALSNIALSMKDAGFVPLAKRWALRAFDLAMARMNRDSLREGARTLVRVGDLRGAIERLDAQIEPSARAAICLGVAEALLSRE